MVADIFCKRSRKIGKGLGLYCKFCFYFCDYETERGRERESERKGEGDREMESGSCKRGAERRSIISTVDNFTYPFICVNFRFN